VVASRRTRIGRAALALSLLTGSVVAAAATTAHAAPDGLPTLRHHKVEHPTRGSRRSPGYATSNGSGNLTYQGGVDGIGVTTGTPKVYLVFWGAGWGTAGTNAAGDVTLSGDTRAIAPVLQEFFKGLGTNSEGWSGVLTQYCEGVAVGTVTCPASSTHVGYPTGGAFAGVWVDTSATNTSPVDHDIAAEAIVAAGHFGNTTAASNRSAQYVIVSPTGTHPGGFNTPTANWCAWHDYNGDTTLVGGAAASPYGDIAFTNLPYIPDMGASCGANYVNASGALDGVTIVEGHEYAETVTDQNPAGGWIDRTGYENGDKCAWVGVGGAGGAQNLALATGSFAVQGTWSNDGAACLVSHSIVATATTDFSLSASPTAITAAAGAAASTSINSAITLGTPGPIALTVSGVPAGASAALSSSSIAAGASTTLTITNTSAVTGSYAVTVTGTSSGVAHTATVTFSVPGVVNGGFESSFTGWTRSGTTSTSTNSAYRHSGNRGLVAGSTTNRTNGDSGVSQTFTANGSTLSFWYKVRCAETVSVDWTTATLVDTTTATTTVVLPNTCTNTGAWVQVTAPIVPGHAYTLKLVNHDNNSSTSGRNTYTAFDDVVG
jgi:serine protease